MRTYTTLFALAASTVLLAGCAGGGPETDSDTVAETATATETTTKRSTTAPTQEAPAARTVADVPEDRFMPPGAQGARVFTLADGVTGCFINSLGADSFLTCRTNFADAPMVQDYEGNDVAANAVSWTPDGVIYAHMSFPDNDHVPETLHPYERVAAFGFTCTAYGPATVECSGPQGSASLDAGSVTGAAVPPKKAAPQQAPAPAPGLPEIQVPELPDPLGVLPGQ